MKVFEKRIFYNQNVFYIPNKARGRPGDTLAKIRMN